jgi:hypothetical protein
MNDDRVVSPDSDRQLLAFWRMDTLRRGSNWKLSRRSRLRVPIDMTIWRALSCLTCLPWNPGRDCARSYNGEPLDDCEARHMSLQNLQAKCVVKCALVGFSGTSKVHLRTQALSGNPARHVPPTPKHNSICCSMFPTCWAGNLDHLSRSGKTVPSHAREYYATGQELKNASDCSLSNNAMLEQTQDAVNASRWAISRLP